MNGLTSKWATWLGRRCERLVDIGTACRTAAGGAGPASTSALIRLTCGVVGVVVRPVGTVPTAVLPRMSFDHVPGTELGRKVLSETDVFLAPYVHCSLGALISFGLEYNRS